METVEQLAYEIIAKTDRLEAGMKKVEAALGKPEKQVKSLQQELDKLSKAYKHQATVAGMNKAERATHDLERKIKSLTGQHGKLTAAQQQQVRAMRGYIQQTHEVEKRTSAVGGVMKRVGAIAVTYLSVRSLGSLVRYSDEVKRLEGRLKVVTDNAVEFQTVQTKLQALAEGSRASIKGTVDLYSRLAINLGDNEEAMRNILPVTEAIQKGIAITGESAASAQGAIVQFSQGLATNFSAAGQEIRSLQEQAPRVAKALADGLNELGVTVNATAGDLNHLAQDGVITTTNAMEALSTQVDVLRAEFEKTPKTIGQALTALDNAFLKLIGRSDLVEAGTGTLTAAIVGLADVLNAVADAGEVAAMTDEELEQRHKELTHQTIGLTDALDKARLGTQSYGHSVEALTELQAIEEEQTRRSIAAYLDKVDAINKAQGTSFVTEATFADMEAIDKYIGNLEKQAEAAKQTAAQKAADKAETELRNIAEKNGLPITEEAIKKARQLAAASETTSKAKSRAKSETEKLQDAIDKLVNRNGVKAATVGMSELDAALFEFDNSVEQLTEKYGQLSESQQASIEATRTQIEVWGKSKEAIEEQQKVTEEYRSVFENAMDGIQDVVTDTFEGLFDGSIDSAGDAAEAIKKIFFRMAAELATLELLRMTGLPGGISQFVQGGSVTGLLSGGGGGGISDLMSAGSFLSNLPSFNQFMTANLGSSAFGGIGQAINNFGTNFGFAAGPLQGPTLTGAPLTGGGPTLLGGASMGSIGGLGAQLLGLGSGNMAIDTIAGLAGGVGGSALAGALGASAFAGPIGILGGFALTALGGSLFGKKPSDKGQWATSGIGGNLLEQGGLEGKKFSQENRDAAIQLSQLAGVITDTLDNIAGVQAEFDQIRVKIGNRDSNFVAFGKGGIDTEDIQFTGRSQEALMDALITGVVDGLSGLPDELRNAFDNIDFGGDIEDALGDVNFITLYSSMGKLPDVVNEIEQAVKAMEAQFDEAAATAERLGLSVQKVRNEQERQMDEMRRQTDQSLSAQILSIIDPAQLAIIEEKKRYEQQLANLKAIGAEQDTLNKAEVYHQLMLQQAVEQTGNTVSETITSFTRLQSSFKSFLDDLEFGTHSGKSPVGNLDAMRARVEELGRKAQLGDVEASEELAQLLPAFLDLSGSVNGFNEMYAQDRALAEQLAQSALSTAERQIALMQMQVSATVEGFAGLNASITELLQQNSVTVSGLVSSASSSAPAFNEAAYLAANPDVAAALARGELSSGRQHYDIWGANEIAQGRRAQGFAFGGRVRGGNAIDNIPVFAGEDEFWMRADAVRKIGPTNLAYMNSTGSMPAANDNSQVVRLLEQILASQTAGNRDNAALLYSANQELSGINENAVLESAR